MDRRIDFSSLLDFPWPTVQEHSSLLQGLSRFEIFQIAGSLQLKATTPAELIVFHRLAALGRSLTGDCTGKLSSGRLRKIIRLREISGEMIRVQADPPMGPLSVEIPSPIGPTTVFQGLNSFSGTETFSMLAAIQTESTELSDELRRSIKALSKFVLLISQMLASRAEISPNTFLTSNEYSTPRFSNREMADLSRIVTFKTEEVLESFSPDERLLITRLLFLSQEDKDPLSTDSVFDKTTLLSPFYECGETIVVHSPMDLLPALQHAAVRIANELDQAEELFNMLAKTNRAFLKTLIEKYGQLIPGELTDSGNDLLIHTSNAGGSKITFRFQPPTEGYPPHASNSNDRLDPANSMLPLDYPNIDVLVLSNFGAGDSMRFYGFESEEHATIVHLEELEIILHYLDYDLTRLIYFIRAFHKQDSLELTFSMLDPFALYREHQWSFYLSDDGYPTSIFIDPNTGSVLSKQYYDEVKPRWFVIPNTAQIVKAVKADMHRPNWYVAPLDGGPIYFIDISLVTISIIKEVSFAKTENTLANPRMNFADSLFGSFAFWLNEFLSWLPPHKLHFSSSILAIYVTFDDTREHEPRCQLYYRGGTELLLKCHVPDLSEVENVDSIDPDSFIIEDVAMVTQHLLGWSPAELEHYHQNFLVECYFRRMRVFTRDSLEQALNSSAPTARLLSEEQISKGLDELGEYLRGKVGFEVGDIAKDARVRILNKWIVPFFGDALASKIDSYSKRFLLTELLLRHEALIQFSTKFRNDFSVLANDPKAAKDLAGADAEKLSIISSTLLSSRFLIEYTSFTSSVDGQQRINDEEYDHMLSLSSEVISRGILSDSLDNQLADVKLSILPSGRLGISRDDEYLEAVEKFVNTKLRQADFALPSLDWFLNDDALIAQAQEVFRAENGITISDLSNVVLGLIDRLDNKALDVSVDSSEDIVHYLADNRRVTHETASEVLKLLTLSTGHGKKEAFWQLGNRVRPWRFNRKHSILNQPIIPISKDNTTELLYGKRTLQQAYQYNLQKLIESRGEGSSKEARSFNSRINDKKGKAFETQTEEAVKNSLRGKVLSRISKFGTVDLKNYKGKNLGDIDLIYADEISRSLWVAELKSILGGRLPGEYASELQKIYGKNSSAETQLRKRLEVVIENLDLVLTRFGISPNGAKWNVNGVILVENDILSAHLYSGEFPVLTVNKFIHKIRAFESESSQI